MRVLACSLALLATYDESHLLFSLSASSFFFPSFSVVVFVVLIAAVSFIFSSSIIMY